MKNNDVTSFFFYMWNMWCEEECMAIFDEVGLGVHFWNKWCGFHSLYGPSNAIPSFYAELSDSNRDLLVRRATECYNRSEELK